MKKNAIIYINDTQAQVTKAFEKQARIFGTPEYREWRAYRQDFHQQGAYQGVQRPEGNRRHPAEPLPRCTGLVPLQVPQV